MIHINRLLKVGNELIRSCWNYYCITLHLLNINRCLVWSWMFKDYRLLCVCNAHTTNYINLLGVFRIESEFMERDSSGTFGYEAPFEGMKSVFMDFILPFQQHPPRGNNCTNARVAHLFYIN